MIKNNQGHRENIPEILKDVPVSTTDVFSVKKETKIKYTEYEKEKHRNYINNRN